MVVNNQVDPLARFYGVLNDYGFPVFPGVYLIGTTAHTEFASPPSLAVNSSNQGVGPNPLPSSNNLPYWFYDTSNVAIVNATGITGWFSVLAYDYPFFLTDNVEFWNSTNMLIANDTFNSEAQALLLYNGHSSANRGAVGNATIWGNTFLQAIAPQPSTVLVPASYGLGLSEQENLDTIYNNYFQTPTTAVSFPIDLYYGYLTYYTNSWNITPTAASAVNHDSNWPAFALTGSIIGGATQGGNFWWDYGITFSGDYLVQAAFAPFYNSNPYD
ncbi:thermopsin precursor related protein [mine drainage metagenome]|uniref:Thermopsin related protein n=1 Tax=mine drainage metagenome TaxID=410659 RepID=T1BKB2_9ZZZZ